jgi:hypothetical protein
MLHDFTLAGRRVRLWQRVGETYEHVLLKALGFAMFVPVYPNLEIETRLGLRYTPDLIAVKSNGDYAFWGECGLNSIRKTHWILKHTRTEKMVLFKHDVSAGLLIKKIRAEIPEKYRWDGRLRLINFVSDIVNLTADRQIAKVSQEWFEEFII